MKAARATVKHLIIISICLVSFFPFYWLLNTSLQTPEELFVIPPNLFPGVNLLESYRDYLANSNIMTWMRNTFIIGIATTFIASFIGLPAAFSLSRFRYKLRTPFIFLILFTQMMSAALLCIPIYIIFAQIKLVNTLWPLVTIYSCSFLPICVWFAKGFFDSVPIELDHAARIDGCTTAGVLIRISVPLIRPGIIATAMWVFIASWDEYLYARTLIDSPNLWTNSVGLAAYIGQYSTPWNEIMSGAVMVTLPVVFIFMYFQKHLVSGLTAGSVKE